MSGGEFGKVKMRNAKTRKTRVIKREMYSRRDFKDFKNGEEIYETITKLIDEEGIEAGKREGIYCTVYKHLQGNARTSMIHDMTPDLTGSVELGTKERLAVLLSISRRDVDKLVRNSTQELKIDVLIELSEGDTSLSRYPVRYYTTTEDVIGYVLKDKGVTDSALDYQLTVIKAPFKGKSKIKSIMCAVGANNQSSPAHHKESKALLPYQYPLQELGPSPKVDVNNTDGIPRVTNCYLYVSPREAQELTVYHRQENGEVEEEVLSLRPSVTTQEIIQETVKTMELANDALSYRLIIKTFEFDNGDEVGEEDRPLTFVETEEQAPGYPKFYLEPKTPLESVRAASRSTSTRSHGTCSSSSKPFAYAISDSSPAPLGSDPHSTSTNTESLNFLRLGGSVRDLETYFMDPPKSSKRDPDLREKFRNLLMAFEDEKHSKDKLKIRKEKIKGQLKETTEALLESRMDNEELIRHLKDEERAKQEVEVECQGLRDEVDHLERKIAILQSIEDDRKTRVEEEMKSSGGGKGGTLESQKSWDTYQTLYEDLTQKHGDMNSVLSGTIDRMKMEVGDLKKENLALETRNAELTEKITILEPKCEQKSKELDNINEMIEALNLQVEDVRGKCSQGLCPGSLKVLEEMREKDTVIGVLTNQVNKGKVKKKELNTEIGNLEKHLHELESTRDKADERYIEIVKEAEALRVKLADRDATCEAGSCPSGIRCSTKDTESKFMVQHSEDRIETLTQKVEKLNEKRDELRKELAIYKMEMTNSENTLQNAERARRRAEKDLEVFRTENVELRKRCEEGRCPTASAKESDLLAETKALLRSKIVLLEEMEENLEAQKEKFAASCLEKDALKMKVSDLEALLEKAQTHSRILTNETVAMSGQIADLERQVESEVSKREELKSSAEDATKDQEWDEDEDRTSEALLPISRSSSQLSTFSDSGSPSLEELTEAKKKIKRQRDKIRGLKEEYLNLKDLVSSTNAKIYDIMSDDKACVKPACREIRHNLESTIVERNSLKNKLEHAENKNMDMSMDLSATSNKLAKKREDYASLQALLRTTLENCKEFEVKLRNQSAALRVAEAKGWVQPSQYTTPVNTDHSTNGTTDKSVSFLTCTTSTDKTDKTPQNPWGSRVVAPVRRPSSKTATRSKTMSDLMKRFEK